MTDARLMQYTGAPRSVKEAALPVGFLVGTALFFLGILAVVREIS